jgi:uncharacterized protein YcbX
LALVKLTIVKTPSHSQSLLKLSARSQQALYLPPPLKPPQEAQRVTFSLHKQICYGHLEREEYHDWFSRLLGIKVRLVAQYDQDERYYDPSYSLDSTPHLVSYADAFPYLITNQESFEGLKSRYDPKLSMDRFRSNLVISGALDSAEFSWKTLKIGEIIFHLVKPCSRCQVITINQNTAIRDDKKILKILSQFRTLDHQDFTGPIFGDNAIASCEGIVKIGDSVTLLETKEPYHLKSPLMANSR